MIECPLVALDDACIDVLFQWWLSARPLWARLPQVYQEPVLVLWHGESWSSRPTSEDQVADLSKKLPHYHKTEVLADFVWHQLLIYVDNTQYNTYKTQWQKTGRCQNLGESHLQATKWSLGDTNSSVALRTRPSVAVAVRCADVRWSDPCMIRSWLDLGSWHKRSLGKIMYVGI